MTTTQEALVRVEHLKKHFSVRGGSLFRKNDKAVGVRAVDDVSFEIRRGETYALMGESGCGKTTCARSMIRLVEPTSGHVYFEGEDLASMSDKALWKRRKEFQIVFQNPQEAMDPLLSVRNTIEEPLKIHHPHMSRSERRDVVLKFAAAVGLQESLLKRYPRELSGGEQQRVCVCRALILTPKFLILDEPTSALDVSVQSRVLNLLCDLKRDFDLTYLFISHDAAVIRWMADRMGVLYLGQLVEAGDTETIFSRASHPYSAALIQSVLTVGTRLEEKKVVLKGSPPSPKAGERERCAFYERCTKRSAECETLPRPALVEKDADHWVSCRLASKARRGTNVGSDGAIGEK